MNLDLLDLEKIPSAVDEIKLLCAGLTISNVRMVIHRYETSTRKHLEAIRKSRQLTHKKIASIRQRNANAIQQLTPKHRRILWQTSYKKIETFKRFNQILDTVFPPVDKP